MITPVRYIWQTNLYRCIDFEMKMALKEAKVKDNRFSVVFDKNAVVYQPLLNS